MITDITLDPVLPIDQGKHLPRFRLQGTKSDRVWLVYPIGPDVSTRGYLDGPKCVPPATSLAFRATPDAPDGYSKPTIKA